MIAVYIVLGILGAVLLFYIIPTLIISNVIYTVLFVRTSKEKWSRTVSWDDEEQKEMFLEEMDEIREELQEEQTDLKDEENKENKE